LPRAQRAKPGSIVRRTCSHRNGENVAALPLIECKERLRGAIEVLALRFSDYVIGGCPRFREYAWRLRCAAVECVIVVAENDVLEVIVKIDNDFPDLTRVFRMEWLMRAVQSHAISPSRPSSCLG
jgi:hypothetical protein